MTLTLAILGDSIAYGQGASRPADTIGPRLAAHLITSGIPTEVRVFAVPRARSSELVGQVQQARAWGAQVALIIIGANDLTHFVPTQDAAAQLGGAVRDLRACGAQVVVAPAPDLSVVPWVPAQLRSLVRAGSDLLRAAQTHAALAEGARVADLNGSTSAMFAADGGMFSGDRFHPSSAGYALIAQALAPAVRAASAEAGRNG